MEKLENFLTTVSKFNINIDTDTIGYYWYKVSVIDAIFSFIGYLSIGIVIGVVIYFTALQFKDFK